MTQTPSSGSPLSDSAAPTHTATHMFREAGDAHLAVRAQISENASTVAALAERLRANPPRAVVTCGRGSSDHAATYAKYLIETRCGVLTSSAAPSVTSIYAAGPDMDDVLFLAISQSGRSPDLLATAEAAKAAGATVVALVNDSTSPLAVLASEVLALRAGPEISVAATKSYIAALAAVVQLVAAWTRDTDLGAALYDLPANLRQAWELDWSAAIPVLKPARNLYVLGRGLGFGIAQEAALKLKETCGLHAEAFSTAEVLHGPMAIVQTRFPIMAFAQDDETREGVLSAARDLSARGADVLVAASEPPAALPTLAAHPAIEPILMAQSFYRMASALAVARGYNPDKPPHLRKVTETV